MTISEIARAADVPVETVLRVLNQETVSSDVVARVLTAMDAYGYGRLPPREGGGQPGAGAPDAREQPNRAEHAQSPRRVAGEIVEQTPERDVEADDAVGRAREQLLRSAGDVMDELASPEAVARRSDPLGTRALSDRMRIVDARLERVSQDLDGVKRELARARTERLEDLRLLVDLITTSWRAADRRLGRIDRKLERMEGLPDGGRDALPTSERRFGPRRF